MKLRWVLICTAIMSFICCKKENSSEELINTKFIPTPTWFPSIKFPSDNAYSEERWKLGKRLFYDKKLSKSQTISCASCHKQELSFSDNIPFSIGENNLKGKSNSPPLFNLAYHPYYTRAGGVPTLEMQILVPIEEHNEFDFNIVELSNRLKMDSTYSLESLNAYGKDISPFVITRAIANFERSLISGNSPYDFFYYAKNDNAINNEQKKGMELFFGDRTNCSKCHSGFNFTNYAFRNNGLFNEYADNGRMTLTKLDSDKALFKTPSLRNIELTAPYMHNGMFSSLEEVINHYNSGGKNHPNKSPLLKPLNLTDKEKKDLVLFLKSLTDKQFIHNINFK